MFDALQQEFGKLDASARAAARFERQVYESLRQQRLDEGWAQEDAGELPEVFDRAWFSRGTASLAIVSMMSRLVKLFGLDQHYQEIMSLVVAQTFESTQPKTKDVFLGHEVHAALKQLRDRRTAQQ